MYRYFKVVLLLLAMAYGPSLSAQKKTGQPVDIVFCLDLSNSSNGLISKFRNNLWDYWYYFSQCKNQPNYRIAVVTYARNSYGISKGYTRVVRDFGTDFEKLSNQLFRIPPRTERGEQHVGSALNACMKLSWSKDTSAKKIIFLVGNGEVTLGKDDIDVVTNKLIKNNIVVHSIYCIAPGERQAISGWETVALKTGGQIFSMSLHTVYFDTLSGFDMKKLRTLNRRLNNTYLYYGKGGALRRKMLTDEDNHIYVTNTEGYRFRSMYKVSWDYQRKNSSWDLVDLYYKNPVAFRNVERQYLNDTCRKMNDDELKAYIIYKKYERRKWSSQISEMFAEQEQRSGVQGNAEESDSPTLDMLSLKLIAEALKETNCDCTSLVNEKNTSLE